LYDYIIGAYTASILSVINVIRSLIFLNKNNINKSLYVIILIFLRA